MKQYFMIGFIIASIILSGYAVQAQSIVINEIMASNKDAVFDEIIINPATGSSFTILVW